MGEKKYDIMCSSTQILLALIVYLNINIINKCHCSSQEKIHINSTQQPQHNLIREDGLQNNVNFSKSDDSKKVVSPDIQPSKDNVRNVTEDETSLVFKFSGTSMKETHKPRTILDALDSMVDDLLHLNVFGYSLEKLLQYKPKEANLKVDTDGKMSLFWNLLRVALTKASKGRGKKDHKGHAMVMSALITLGVLVPVVFSTVALMAKKALISSLVALAISIYSLTNNKGGAVKGKQTYEAEEVAPQSAKYGDYKFNSPPAAGIDYPSPPNIPYSFPLDDTKYFNTRPAKNQDDEDRNEHRTQTNRFPKEPNQYEVTERNDVAKARRPLRPSEHRPLYDQEHYNTNTVTEAYRPGYDDDETESRYRNVDSERQPSTHNKIRYGKENLRDRDLGKQIHQYYEKKNPASQNDYAYEKYSNNKLKDLHNNLVECEQNKPNDKEQFRNKHFSSKYNTQSQDYEASTTTEYYVYRIETPPTEQDSAETTSQADIVYNDSVNSENEFKPMIVTTPSTKYNKNAAKQEFSSQTNYKKDRPYKLKPYYNIEDNRQYQNNLNEKPSPVYKPSDKGSSEERGMSGVTLSYIPKIKSSSNSTN